MGPDARIEQVQELALGQNHEASCFNPDTKQLFFAELGGPGGTSADGLYAGSHSWQYLLDTETNVLRNVTTSPPTFNVHGCVYYHGAYHVVTDGSPNGTATLARIDPSTLESTTLLDNYYQQPFISFNDLDIDPDGNFWLADSISGWVRAQILLVTYPSLPPPPPSKTASRVSRDHGLTMMQNSGVFPKTFYPQTSPTIYFVNGTTMRPRVAEVLPLDSNANGVTVSKRAGGSGLSVYVGQTGLSQALNKVFDPSTQLQFNRRGMLAFDTGPGDAGLLTNRRLLSVAIAYQYDGIRASRNGWLFAAGGEGVDVLDPRTGITLGTIRAAGPRPRMSVNVAFGEHEMWVVGDGGVWHVSGIKETLARGW